MNSGMVLLLLSATLVTCSYSSPTKTEDKESAPGVGSGNAKGAIILNLLEKGVKKVKTLFTRTVAAVLGDKYEVCPGSNSENNSKAEKEGSNLECASKRNHKLSELTVFKEGSTCTYCSNTSITYQCNTCHRLFHRVEPEKTADDSEEALPLLQPQIDTKPIPEFVVLGNFSSLASRWITGLKTALKNCYTNDKKVIKILELFFKKIMDIGKHNTVDLFRASNNDINKVELLLLTILNNDDSAIENVDSTYDLFRLTKNDGICKSFSFGDAFDTTTLCGALKLFLKGGSNLLEEKFITDKFVDAVSRKFNSLTPKERDLTPNDVYNQKERGAHIRIVKPQLKHLNKNKERLKCIFTYFPALCESKAFAKNDFVYKDVLTLLAMNMFRETQAAERTSHQLLRIIEAVCALYNKPTTRWFRFPDS